MRKHAITRSAGLVLMLAVAACGSVGATGSPGSSGPLPAVSGAPADTPSPTPVPGDASPAADATAVRLDQPPEAQLAGLSTGAVAGDQGSFTWDGLVSDAPWIVGREGGTVRPGGTLGVSLRPALVATAWQARWAPVAADTAGEPADGGSGGPGSPLLRAPGAPGSWSLQLTVQFGEGRTATWYWRVRVAP